MDAETREWFSQTVPEYGALSDAERGAIESFAFLWSYFEGTMLEGEASVPKLRAFARLLDDDGRLERLDIDGCVAYLRHRYYEGGAFSHHFEHLHLDRNGNPEEAFEMLVNPHATQLVRATGALIILYRFRNNLFHGIKWEYGLRDQQENFLQANALLRQIAEL